MSLFGFGSTKDKSWIDGKTSDAQWQNYKDAQGLTPTYTPTSAAQVQTYMNPYSANVVDQSLAALDRERQTAVNQIGDQAAAAHAFGGSRHGVAQGITNGQYGQQAGLLASQLYNQGYGQALQTAQNENQYGYQYPIARQGLLNSSLSQLTPITYSKQQSPTQALNNTFSLAQGIGGIVAGVGGAGTGAAAPSAGAIDPLALSGVAGYSRYRG